MDMIVYLVGVVVTCLLGQGLYVLNHLSTIDFVFIYMVVYFCKLLITSLFD